MAVLYNWKFDIRDRYDQVLRDSRIYCFMAGWKAQLSLFLKLIRYFKEPYFHVLEKQWKDIWINLWIPVE